MRNVSNFLAYIGGAFGITHNIESEGFENRVKERMFNTGVGVVVGATSPYIFVAYGTIKIISDYQNDNKRQ